MVAIGLSLLDRVMSPHECDVKGMDSGAHNEMVCSCAACAYHAEGGYVRNMSGLCILCALIFSVCWASEESERGYDVGPRSIYRDERGEDSHGGSESGGGAHGTPDVADPRRRSGVVMKHLFDASGWMDDFTSIADIIPQTSCPHGGCVVMLCAACMEREAFRAVATSGAFERKVPPLIAFDIVTASSQGMDASIPAFFGGVPTADQAVVDMSTSSVRGSEGYHGLAWRTADRIVDGAVAETDGAALEHSDGSEEGDADCVVALSTGWPPPTGDKTCSLESAYAFSARDVRRAQAAARHRVERFLGRLRARQHLCSQVLKRCFLDGSQGTIPRGAQILSKMMAVRDAEHVFYRDMEGVWSRGGIDYTNSELVDDGSEDACELGARIAATLLPFVSGVQLCPRFPVWSSFDRADGGTDVNAPKADEQKHAEQDEDGRGSMLCRVCGRTNRGDEVDYVDDDGVVGLDDAVGVARNAAIVPCTACSSRRGHVFTASGADEGRDHKGVTGRTIGRRDGAVYTALGMLMSWVVRSLPAAVTCGPVYGGDTAERLGEPGRRGSVIITAEMRLWRSLVWLCIVMRWSSLVTSACERCAWYRLWWNKRSTTAAARIK